MSAHLSRSIEQLKKKLLSVATLAEESVNKAMCAFLERNAELAHQVLDTDDQIDQEEVEIEEECLKMLALHQPVAIDLRFIVAILKINNDLERTGDLASNIARRALSLCEMPEVDFETPLELMNQKTQSMLKRSIDALIKMDSNLAHEVIKSDEEVDALNKDTYKIAHKVILKNPQDVRRVFFYVSVSRNLERIADLATNISEDVIYMIDGKIVRHRHLLVD